VPSSPSDNEPITPEQIAEIVKLAATGFPADEPGAGESADNTRRRKRRAGQTSSKVQKTFPRAPVGNEISGDAAANAIALVRSAPVERAEICAQEPEEESAPAVGPDRSRRILLWITATVEGRALWLKLSPSPSTKTDGEEAYVRNLIVT